MKHDSNIQMHHYYGKSVAIVGNLDQASKGDFFVHVSKKLIALFYLEDTIGAKVVMTIDKLRKISIESVMTTSNT